MAAELDKKYKHSIDGKMEVPYRNYVGKLASDFFIKLRDAKKISATKCSKCNKVYVPPKVVCSYCFGELKDLVEISDIGTVESFTEVTYKEPVQPIDAPIIYGIIKLDRADTGMVHMIGGIAPKDIKIGMKVQAVYQDKREGSILDIKYFKPAD
jgi:uncharacterized protein